MIPESTDPPAAMSKPDEVAREFIAIVLESVSHCQGLRLTNCAARRSEGSVVLMKPLLPLRRPRCLAIFAFVFCTVESFGLACNVPVFRYALEHWRPDAYRAVVLHRGPLSWRDQELLKSLQNQSESAVVNMSIRAVDLDQTVDPADKELAAVVDAGDLPHLVVRYPAYLRLDQPVWSGAFNGEVLSTLFDSPIRRTVLQRLSAGQTAVWLMIDSGNTMEDNIASATLERELKALQQTLKLPELTDSPEDVIQDGPPVRLEFSLLRIRRDDAAEQALIPLLLGCESDLAALKEPLVFPVFGRCRAMLPLVGPGISPENIRSSATFLSGACSCQVKELNPGFDLLITANWKELLSWAKSPAFASGEMPVGEPVQVPIPTGSGPVKEQPVELPSATSASSAPSPVSSTAGSSPVAMVILACIALAAAVAGLLAFQWK